MQNAEKSLRNGAKTPAQIRLLWRWSGLVLLGLWGAGCASCPPGLLGAKPSKTPAPYMRVANPDADTVELQIAVRKFVPARRSGPVLWLTGASHLGETNYYEALQKHLDVQALVLYEGVKGFSSQAAMSQEAHRRTTSSVATNSPRTQPAVGPAASLQVTMAHSLGLVFQLEALQYDRPQFRNSDLSVDQIQDLMRANQRVSASESHGGQESETEFSKLAQTMQGTSLLGALATGVLGMIGGSERLQALMKLAMIELLGHLKDDLSQLAALPPEMKRLMVVLVQERNKAVISDLQAELKSRTPARSIAVLYGAGHLPDLEQRLRKQLKYCPVDEFWLPVFSVNTERAGLTQFEIGFVRGLVRAELEELQAGQPR